MWCVVEDLQKGCVVEVKVRDDHGDAIISLDLSGYVGDYPADTMSWTMTVECNATSDVYVRTKLLATDVLNSLTILVVTALRLNYVKVNRGEKVRIFLQAGRAVTIF